jgi:hypothetical protein
MIFYMWLWYKKIAWRLVLFIFFEASPNAAPEINSQSHALPIYRSPQRGGYRQAKAFYAIYPSG